MFVFYLLSINSRSSFLVLFILPRHSSKVQDPSTLCFPLGHPSLLPPTWTRLRQPLWLSTIFWQHTIILHRVTLHWDVWTVRPFTPFMPILTTILARQQTNNASQCQGQDLEYQGSKWFSSTRLAYDPFSCGKTYYSRRGENETTGRGLAWIRCAVWSRQARARL